MALRDDFARSRGRQRLPRHRRNPRRHDKLRNRISLGGEYPGIRAHAGQQYEGMLHCRWRPSALTCAVYRGAVQLFVGPCTFPFPQATPSIVFPRGWQSGRLSLPLRYPHLQGCRPRLPGRCWHHQNPTLKESSELFRLVYHRETGTQRPPDTLYLGRTSSISDQVPPP